MGTTNLHRESGVTLIEVMVAIFILGIGMISTLALQGTAKSGNLEALQRTQAVLIARDLAERISSNRIANLNDYNGKYDGTTVTSFTNCQSLANCTAAQMVSWDLYQFDQAILGASESRSGKNTGGLIQAEGCVEHNNGVVSIVIAWKGISLGSSATSPIADCGSNINAKERRMFIFTTYVGAAS